jgi:hypothetical protein
VAIKPFKAPPPKIAGQRKDGDAEEDQRGRLGDDNCRELDGVERDPSVIPRGIIRILD